jgi:hypothetical protein
LKDYVWFEIPPISPLVSGVHSLFWEEEVVVVEGVWGEVGIHEE